MVTETHCVCGDEIRRTYGNPSGLPYDGTDSLKVRMSLVTRLLENYPSRIQLCGSCRKEFASQRSSTDTANSQGTTVVCDFCGGEVDSSMRNMFKGPLGSVKSWSGRNGKRRGKHAEEAYERLDVCVDCERAFAEFVEQRMDSSN